jgi:hypothetical protein
MLLVETQPTTTTPALNAVSNIRLRIRSEGTSPQLVELRQGKTTIGSSPRCDIRIQRPGVQPLHCLILCEGGSLSVRRWAAGTRLNGQPFDEAPLGPGDRLAVGDVELELEGVSAGLPVAKIESPWSQSAATSTIEPVSSAPAAQSCESWGEWKSTQHTELSGERQNDATPPSSGTNSVATKDQSAWPEQWAALKDEADQSEGRLTVFQEQLSHLEEKLASWKDARDDWQQERAEWRAEREQAQRHWREVERQIAELQFRASEIVSRIERLEHSIAAHALVPKFEAPRIELQLSEPPEISLAESPATFEPASSSANPFAMPTMPDVEVMAEPQPESEDELAPFAEFSIWRQGAVSEAPSTVGSQGVNPAESYANPQDPYSGSPVTPPVDNNWPMAPAKSFIEQYGHMFADDGADAERPSAATPRLAATDGFADGGSLIRKTLNPEGVQPEGDVPLGTGEDEETIEQYMLKLLQRVRGDGPGAIATQSATTPSLSPSSVLSSDFPPRAAYSTATSGPIAPPSVTANELARTAGNGDWLTTSLGTVRRKSPMVEQPADMKTLRALANESARRAISTHGLRVHRRNAITKVIVSTLAGMTSLLMMLSAPHWKDLQFITACVSLIIAAYWAGQTYAELIDAFRAAAYDGPEDQLQGFADRLPVMFPVDVNNLAKS